MIKSKILEEMLEFIESKDLVALGIFPSMRAVYEARRNKSGPPYIKLKHKIRYSKQSLIEWLEERTVGEK